MSLTSNQKQRLIDGYDELHDFCNEIDNLHIDMAFDEKSGLLNTNYNYQLIGFLDEILLRLSDEDIVYSLLKK